ncbi:Ni,Fe-hydrogenase maturation factor [Thermoproteus tenax]|uniref:Ni,Fe-hydrogenase maturation factor n=1 Tax=Thermoproteus tenax (strain ATCC 35583 / DSM 2078 / JCM 9277 / NBRC 100435 / Kra 1) TaxID=768679 RepID=G4RQ71_THETK|nr:Ni,Fe-hydrogenase maturation factor [Thermoproteus tenax]CCC80708.1 Ni,Fe-hydrogenase maturation factor [Thermoproteus tenax Kra 1]
MRVLLAYVGYILGGDLAVGIEAGHILEREGLPAIELSGDVFAMIDDLRKAAPDVLILIGAVKRGRQPGTLEVYKYVPQRVEDPLEANDLLRPSLEGRISLEDLLAGFRVVDPPAREIYVVECEPPHPDPVVGLSPEGEECAKRLAEKAVELYNYVRDR